jgi:hypothetical protein
MQHHIRDLGSVENIFKPFDSSDEYQFNRYYFDKNDRMTVEECL